MFLKQIKKLKLFDLLLATVVIILGVFFAIFLFKRTKYITVTVKITNENVLFAYNTPPNWYANYFQEGMVVKDGLGKKIVEIKKIYKYDTGANNEALYLTLNINAEYKQTSGQYYFQGRPLIIGSSLRLEFQNILAQGIVTNIEGVRDTRQSREMIVESKLIFNEVNFPETTGAPDYIADNINIGDTVRDSLGNILITIIDKKVEPAKKLVVDSRGNILVGQDPYKKDVYLTLKLKVYELTNAINEHEYYLFDTDRIKVGVNVPLHFDKISIYPTVTKIVEVK